METGKCGPPPPTYPCRLVPFRYANWGGGGWTGGQSGTWNTIDQPTAKPPRDDEDAAYCRHDRCYGECATQPTGWKRFTCRMLCDQNLSRDLISVIVNGGTGDRVCAAAAAAAMANNAGAWTNASGERSETTADGQCCQSAPASGGNH